MTIGDRIRDEKLKYNINKKAQKASVFSSRKLINMSISLVTKYYLNQMI